MLNRWASFLLVILLFSATCFAQKRSSEEMGGGLSFWSVTETDTSIANLDLHVFWAKYFTRNFLFEIEPHATMRFEPDKVELTGLVLANLVKRLVDVSNIDRGTDTQWNRKYEKTTAGIYGSISGGLWAERADNIYNDQIYVGPALAVGVGTHSPLGSLTNIRSKFQYVYLLPAAPLHESPRSMITFTIGFGVITKI